MMLNSRIVSVVSYPYTRRDQNYVPVCQLDITVRTQVLTYLLTYLFDTAPIISLTVV